LTIGVVDTDGKFTAGVNDICGYIFSEIYFNRGYTGGKFATSVNDVNSKLPPASTLPSGQHGQQ
jgi:hypothetical protein